MKVLVAAMLLCVAPVPVQAQLNPRNRCLAEATAKGLWVPPQEGRFRPTGKANFQLRSERRAFMRRCMWGDRNRGAAQRDRFA
jgi:hypothetical protein